MDILKIFKPTEIPENPFPQEAVAGVGSQSSSGGVYSPSEIPDNPLPTKVMAQEVVSQSLNTRSMKILGSYQFTQHGAIQIGKYENQKSGDIRISPDGIVGRNKGGTTTFAIDGDTGDAMFLGTIYASAGLIGGFTVKNSYLYAGTGINTSGLSPTDYPFWAGATYENRATAPFQILPTGQVNTSNIVITGGSLTIGTTFSVTVGGALRATNAIIDVTSESGGGTGLDIRYGDANRVMINGSGVIIRNTRGVFFEETTSGNYASIGMGSDNVFLLKANQATGYIGTDNIMFEDHSGNPYGLWRINSASKHVLDLFSILYLWGTDTDPAVGDIAAGSIWYNTATGTIKAKLGVGIKEMAWL